MRNSIKLTLAAVFSIALSGCFEVEDNSNDEIVAALEAQNANLASKSCRLTLTLWYWFKVRLTHF
jgi:outer membrane lipoprotein-sorting protein